VRNVLLYENTSDKDVNDGIVVEDEYLCSEHQMDYVWMTSM
jgi:hypothetical protein